jgi:hypothetical protein
MTHLFCRHEGMVVLGKQSHGEDPRRGSVDHKELEELEAKATMAKAQAQEQEG